MKKKYQIGVSLLEVVIAMAITVIAMMILWNGVRYFQNTMSHQIRLERFSQTLTMTQELSQAIRGAKKILAVGPGLLELETFNHASYELTDPKLYEETQKIRYVVVKESDQIFLQREIFSSLDAAAPEKINSFLSHTKLIAPSTSTPYFYASYLIGESTVGVRLSLTVQAPQGNENWIPVKEEVYVKAQQ